MDELADKIFCHKPHSLTNPCGNGEDCYCLQHYNAVKEMIEELSVFREAYVEISQVVGRQGTEEILLAQQIRNLSLSQKVYVVMGNDFPDAVYDSEQAASDYIKGKKESLEEKTHRERYGHGLIHWRSYAFELRRKS